MTLTATDIHARSGAPTYMAIAFVVSLIVPMVLPVGPVLLMPHRVVLLAFFIPCLMRLFSGQAGAIIAADWLMLGSALWACLALIVNHGIGNMIEPMGIHIVEFFGAYLLARVSIRSAEDFRAVVKCLFVISLCLLPFAAFESIFKRAILLELIPRSITIVTAPYRLGMRRAQVLFTHPIHFGLFSAIGMGLYWYCIGNARSRLLSVPLVFASTIFSLSSGALITVVCQMVFIAWEAATKTIKARWRVFAGVTAAFYLLAEFGTNRGPWVLLVDYASFNSGSAYNRINIWHFGMENVKANPIFGLGFNEWERPHWMSDSADNFWLLLAMMFGIPAIAMMLAALFIIFRRVARMSFTHSWDRRCQAAYLTAFGGIVIGGSTVHFWTAMMGFVLFFFGSGVWMCTGGGKSDTDVQPPEKPQYGRYTRFPPRAAGDPDLPAVSPRRHDRTGQNTQESPA